MKVIILASDYAYKEHFKANSKYDGGPYGQHLEDVYFWAEYFIHLVPKNKRASVLAACYTHDLIEDCNCTKEEISKAVGDKYVGELTQLLTTKNYPTHEERMNEEYYKQVYSDKNALFIKLCDRLANVSFKNHYKINHKGKKILQRYKKEYPEFKHNLYYMKYHEIFKLIEEYLHEV